MGGNIEKDFGSLADFRSLRFNHTHETGEEQFHPSRILIYRDGRLMFTPLTLRDTRGLFVFGQGVFFVRVESKILGGVLSNQPQEPGNQSGDNPFDQSKHR